MAARTFPNSAAEPAAISAVAAPGTTDAAAIRAGVPRIGIYDWRSELSGAFILPAIFCLRKRLLAE
jgi:hypothetical protein